MSQDLAMKLGVKIEELARAMDANQIFQGELVPVTPLIGKLRIHIQDYLDQKDFLISPLKHYDVMLGTPWFHSNKVYIAYSDRLLEFVHRGKEVQLVSRKKGETIPLVNRVAVGK